MKTQTIALTSALASILLAINVNAQTTSSPAADNTKSNKADATNASATADTQSNSQADIDLTKRIRQSLMADKTLSTYAHNIKIISVSGHVTLNGVVHSEDEKAAIEMKAAEIAGKNSITDDLKVAPK